jgi:glycosyltransferase involved in cell wall biosynthesis
MKILFIDETHEFGGAIISLSYMIKGLRHYGKSLFDFNLITGQPVYEIQRLFPEVNVTRIKPLLTYNHKYKFFRWLSMQKHAFYKKIFLNMYTAFDLLCGCFYSVLISHQIKKIKPDIIHVNNHLDQWASILSAKLSGISCITHQRDFASPSRLLRFSARCSDRIISISDSIKEQLTSIGIENNKITTVYNSTDVSSDASYCPNKSVLTSMGIKERPTCGVFGRITNWKGQHVFIKAIAKVRYEIPNICGIIVGSPPDGAENYLDELKNLVKTLSLHQHIIFTGYQSNLYKLYSEVDVVAHTSIRPEPFGRTIIEAMSAGKPVIATAMGGPLEIIEDGLDGLLIEPDNAAILAEKIVILLKDKTKKINIGINAQKKIKEKFCIEKQANIMEKIYLEIIGN